MVPMFVEDMQFDGADSGAITWGDEVSDEAKAASPVVVIGCGLSGILAGIRLTQAGLPFVIIEKNAGPGRHLVGEPLPGRARRRRQPPLLLRVRAVAPLDRVLLPAARAARLLRPRARQLRAASALPLRHRGDVAHVGRADELLAGRHPQPGRHRGGARGAVRHQRGRFAEHPPDARHPGHGRLRRAVVPLGALARRARPHRHSGSRSWAPARPGSRSRRPSPTPSSSSRSTSGRRSGCCRTRCTTRQVPPGDRWAMQHLPFYARWFRFVMIYPGIAMGTEGYRIDPEFRAERGRRDQRGERAAAPAADRVDHDAPRGPPRPDREVDPRLPGDGEADPAGQRVVVAHAQEAERRARAHRHRAHRPRRRASPSTASSAKPTSSATPPASATTTSSHRSSSPGATACRCASSGATSRPRTSGSRSRTSRTCSACTARARTSRTARACSSTPSARSTTRWTASTGSSRRARRRIEVRKDAHDEYVERYRAEIDQLVWSHPSIDAQPLQEPAGQDLHAVAVAARAATGSGRGRPTPSSTSSADRDLDLDLDRRKFWT